jgi:hypothetical protein
MTVATASLTWKLRQRGVWQVAATTLPLESATRVACTLVREFAPDTRLARSCTPHTFTLTEDVRRFSFVTDDFSLALRLLKEGK